MWGQGSVCLCLCTCERLRVCVGISGEIYSLLAFGHLVHRLNWGSPAVEGKPCIVYVCVYEIVSGYWTLILHWIEPCTQNLLFPPILVHIFPLRIPNCQISLRRQGYDRLLWLWPLINVLTRTWICYFLWFIRRKNSRRLVIKKI